MENNIKASASDLVYVKHKKYLYVPPMIYLNKIKDNVAAKVFGGPDNGFTDSMPS